MTTNAPAEESADTLAAKLARRRDLQGTRRQDRLERLRDRTGQTMERRQILRRAARQRTAIALERAKAASDLSQSAEARALRVQRTRPLTLAVLLPILAAFGLWSTTGVHAGMTRLIGATRDDAMWWALWGLEPALIGTVAWIILVRARLTSAGGRLDQADVTMWTCLSVSVVLNAVGHWPTQWPTGAGALLGHTLGPVGAAMTAHLIGVIEQAITRARPERGEGVRTLADLSRDAFPAPGHEPEEEPPESAPRAPAAPSGWVEVPEGATVLPLVPHTDGTASGHAPEKPRRTGSDQDGQPPSEEGAPKRPNRGKRIPATARKSAKPASARALSDADLAEQLATAIADSGLSQDPSVAAVQRALGVGFERAKRVMALHSQNTRAPALAVIADTAQEQEQDGEAA